MCSNEKQIRLELAKQRCLQCLYSGRRLLPQLCPQRCSERRSPSMWNPIFPPTCPFAALPVGPPAFQEGCFPLQLEPGQGSVGWQDPAVLTEPCTTPAVVASPFPSLFPRNCSCSLISAKVAAVTSAVIYLWAAPVVAGSPHKQWPEVVTSTNHIIFHLGTSRLALWICRTTRPVLTPVQ